MDLAWENTFTAELPGDPVEGSALRQVERAAFSRVQPTPVSAPEVIAWAPDVATTLGVPSQGMVEILSGNDTAGLDPYAMNYGGHQFGNWAGQLGDGRAIALGELNGQTLQLKGAGPTPYSRRADGRAVLRSSIREFLCSEAMHHLGVPTTRALSLVRTGDHVVRDMLYDGNPAPEPGAIVCRVAPSFIRFGTFELPASRGDTETLRAIADYTIRHHFPDLPSVAAPTTETYLRWFERVCETTADMVVDWMRVGFVHGVMNTDNLSIHGITIDYGPYGWLDDFDPGWTPNTTDAHMKRYQYGNQPGIAQWNLVRLANAIYPLIEDVNPLQEALNVFADRFTQGHRAAWIAKLGLGGSPSAADDDLFESLAKVLQSAETDMTIFYRRLGEVDLPNRGRQQVPAPLLEAYYEPDEITPDLLEALHDWLDRYQVRLGGPQPIAEMNKVNPKFVLRNYIAQLAIDAATEGDYSVLHEVYETMKQPYADQPGRDRWAERRPDWARTRVGCSMLSCSS